MRYRKLKANALFNGKRLLQDRVLVLQEDGTVEALLPESEGGTDVAQLRGVLTPGFINCHCHLELSHMKGVIPAGTGLVDFLLSVIRQRGHVEEGKEQYMQAAEKELYQSGTVAIADICNTTDAIGAKQASRLYWHSLVEIINLRDESALEKLAHCEGVQQQHARLQLPAVVTPHAPYSVSARTLQEINARTKGKVISIHNQETAAENELFEQGTGTFLKMFAALGNSQSPFAVSGKSSLQTWLPYFTNGQTLLLVHNTFIREEDIVFANAHATQHGLQLVYCLCPNANVYIENSLPPVELLVKHNCKIVVGTDSYSSNWQLNMASELQTLSKNFPHLSLESLLQWATYNGAAALNLHHLGSFERGKKPGVVLLNTNDFTATRMV